MISRIHAHVMHLSDETWKIRDNHSVNGLFVNGVKVHEAALAFVAIILFSQFCVPTRLLAVRRDGDMLTFGGGGNMAFGMKKDQIESSEFIYRFRGTQPAGVTARFSPIPAS